MKKKMVQSAIAGIVMFYLCGGLFAFGHGDSKNAQINIHNATMLEGTWEPLGEGTENTIADIEVVSGKVYAVGGFMKAGGDSAKRAAVWDGSAWHALGKGLYGGDYAEGEPPDWADPSVNEVCWDGDNIIAAGFFRNAGSVSAYNVARWDGTNWSAMDYLGGWYNNIDGVYTLEMSDQFLYGGGRCMWQGGIGRWDGTEWIALNPGGYETEIAYSISASGSDVYVGGSINRLRYMEVHNIARYDELTDTWFTLGPPGAEGTNQSVGSIAAWGDDVYVSGAFTSAGGVAVNHFARWNKQSGLWSAFGVMPGDGDNFWIGSLVVYGDALYAAVREDLPGNDVVKVMKWQGGAWYILGETSDGGISKIVATGDHVYAAGSFKSMNGTPANHVARWSSKTSLSPYEGFSKVGSDPVVTDDGASIGCAWGDYNNDGYDDLFIANDDDENNFLYANNGDGTFTKVTGGPVVSDGGRSFAGAWGDMDNDGDLDLYVANIADQVNFLYSNNGDGTFTKVTAGDIVTDADKSWGCAWADYNNDGNLDLYVANMAGDNNCLYAGHGDGTFTKVTAGDIVNDGGNSASAGWCDFDLDGDVDLFVANTEGENNFFYINNGDGTFLKATSGPLVTDGGESWSMSWGDYNNDGNPDLFVGNNGEANSLYRNSGNSTFSKIVTGDIVTGSQHTRSSCWGDINKDGLLDLLITNKDEETHVNINDGNGLFALYSLDLADARGCALSDFDHDGDPDLCIVNNGSNNLLYKNTAAPGNHWLTVRCIGSKSNFSAVGARVKVKAAVHGVPVWQAQQIALQSGFAGQSSLAVYFGLGEAVNIDSVQIIWPSGQVWYSTNVAADQILLVTEDDPSVNRTPVAQDDSLSVNENSIVTIHVLSNDSDPDGHELHIQSLDLSGTLGTAVIDPGDTTITYTAPIDYSGTDIFIYSITDGNGGLDTASVYIEILALNQPPVAMNDTVTIQQDSTVIIFSLINDSDPDDDPLYIESLLDEDVTGTVVVNSGDTSMAYIPPAGWSGETVFDYVVSDGNGGLDTATVFITVTPVSAVEDQPVPMSFGLHQNYPNPFNPVTTISYALPEKSHVILRVYSVMGSEICTLVNEEKSVGQYEAAWNAQDRFGRPVSSGIYFYQLKAGDYSEIRKMLLVR